MELVNELYAQEDKLSRRSAGSDPAGAGAAAWPLRALRGRGTVGVARPHRPGVPPALAGYDEELAKEDAAEIVLQVNGKVRGRIHVPFGTRKKIWNARLWPIPACNHSSPASRW